MEKFTLELIFQIIGIGSASGLIYQSPILYLIGDNSGYLYEFQTEDQQLLKHPIIENPSENIPKKDKPDFEAITQFEDKIYVFGSGSTSKRTTMVEINTHEKEIRTKDLTDLYGVMQSFGQIKPKDFNLEGAIYTGNEWYLFNRGNGRANKNVVFTVYGKNLVNEYNILSNDYKLPKINGVRSSFTDAVLVEDKIYFLATAEDTQSTYLDGAVLGSLIGCIDIQTMKIDFTLKISDTHKFEGITLYQNSTNSLEFLLCEDNDSEIQEAKIYKLSLRKP